MLIFLLLAHGLEVGNSQFVGLALQFEHGESAEFFPLGPCGGHLLGVGGRQLDALVDKVVLGQVSAVAVLELVELIELVVELVVALAVLVVLLALVALVLILVVLAVLALLVLLLILALLLGVLVLGVALALLALCLVLGLGAYVCGRGCGFRFCRCFGWCCFGLGLLLRFHEFGGGLFYVPFVLGFFRTSATLGLLCFGGLKSFQSILQDYF